MRSPVVDDQFAVCIKSYAIVCSNCKAIGVNARIMRGGKDAVPANAEIIAGYVGMRLTATPVEIDCLIDTVYNKFA